VIVGSAKQYPTERVAQQAAEALRLRLNVDGPGAGPVTVGGLIERYIAEELPERWSTRCSYLSCLRRWLIPKWGEHLLSEVRAMAVEQWLRSLPLAPKTKSHLRGVFHLLYENARRWEMVDRNPIELVRQSAKRLSTPRVLNPDEVRRILEELREPYRTMVLTAACLGLRASEIVGLKWSDFDWLAGTVLVERSVVHGRVGDTKTEYSRQPLPLHAALAERLRNWRHQTVYDRPVDWVFANDAGRPRWQESILTDYLKPAAVRAGVGKIGWHTFRHTYSTQLRALGTDIKVQQALLRHADIATTMNVYTQAVPEAQRAANGRLVEQLFTAAVAAD
jgi:integrase